MGLVSPQLFEIENSFINKKIPLYKSGIFIFK
jgi:hypothetical protein